MSKQHLMIDYNVNYPSYGQKTGTLLDIECSLEEKMDPNKLQECHFSISWPYISKFGSFIGNYVFDVIYLNHNNGKSIQTYHDTLLNHLQQNMDVTNKYDLELGKYNSNTFVA